MVANAPVGRSAWRTSCTESTVTLTPLGSGCGVPLPACVEAGFDGELTWMYWKPL